MAKDDDEDNDSDARIRADASGGVDSRPLGHNRGYTVNGHHIILFMLTTILPMGLVLRRDDKTGRNTNLRQIYSLTAPL
ncbi:hypothetical protein PI124_g21596 [Phytophthora idaei]|nr:hypothetical protein PI124_g21596 [Phytophthora idaei]